MLRKEGAARGGAALSGSRGAKSLGVGGRKAEKASMSTPWPINYYIPSFGVGDIATHSIIKEEQCHCAAVQVRVFSVWLKVLEATETSISISGE